MENNEDLSFQDDLSSNKERNYLTMESSFRGDLSYSIDFPKYKPSYQLIECQISSEKLCHYTPTLFDLISYQTILGNSEIGPIPDLIDPHTTYARSNQPLCAEDAALLAGLVQPNKLSALAPSATKKNHSKPIQFKSPDPDLCNTSESSKNSFNSAKEQKFVHPLNSSLTPIHVYKVLPHPQFQTTRLMTVGFRNVNLARIPRNSSPLFVLQCSNDCATEHKNFSYSVYTNMPTSTHETSNQHFQYVTSCCTEQFIDVVEDHSDYSIVLDIPENLDLESNRPLTVSGNLVAPQAHENVCVYMLPLYKNKVIFSKTNS